MLAAPSPVLRLRLLAGLMALIAGILAGGCALRAQTLPGERIALVVGNAAYQHVPGLETPVADARAMAARLADLGFEVTLLTDVGPEVFGGVLDGFAKRAQTARTVAFFYAGHAFQSQGDNRLVPVTARLDDAAALQGETWSLKSIAAALHPKGAAGQLLIFLDACRTAPLAGALADQAGPGLAQFDGGAGSFVAFATAPGQVALDKGAGGLNSPFTEALLAHLGTEGQSLPDLMIEVRQDVAEATGGQQVPWEQSSLTARFAFRDPAPPEGDLPLFETVEADSEVLDPAGIALAEAEAGKARVERVEGQGNLRLAALSSETRSLSAGDGRLHVQGVDAGDAPPADLPSAIQTELKRIGCYTGGVDGDWGKGSRAALGRYYEAAKTEAPALDPTEAAWRAVKAAPEKTCKPVAQPVKKKPSTTAKSSGTTSKSGSSSGTTSKPATTTTAPKSGGTGPKCKFIVVAIVCS